MMTEQYTHHLRHRYNSIMTYPADDIPGEKILEVGPGRGDFLFHLAELNPEKVVYAVEIKEKRFDKLITRRDKRELHNIKLILADAAVAIPELFKDSSIETIYINFPDPWPKKRHAKNRLLKKEFLEKCATVLKKDGLIYVTTDVDWYSDEVFEILSTIESIKTVYNGVLNDSDEAYPTLFAEKWKSEGRTIHYIKFKKL